MMILANQPVVQGAIPVLSGYQQVKIGFQKTEQSSEPSEL